MIEIIGLVAATLTTFAFLPQAIQVMKTQSTADLSPIMYASFLLGVLLWLAYGLMLGNIALILANAITAVFAGIVFFFVLKNNVFNVTAKQKEKNTPTEQDAYA